MREDNKLIEAALGGHGKPIINKYEDLDFFNLYTVELRDIKGIPPIWYFAIYQKQKYKMNNGGLIKINRAADRIIHNSITYNQLPLIIISDDSDVRLSHLFKYDKISVFVIDGEQLPGENGYPHNLRNSPFIRLIRNKFSNKDLTHFIFSPYMPNKPAKGWRFFGRKRELDNLVNSLENYFIVGSRRIGKTSLLQEVETKLKERNEIVYNIPVQHCKDASQVVNEIALKLSAQELYKAQKSNQLLNEKFLSSVLKQLKWKNKKITLILDELGNIIFKNQKDDWSIIGVLRDFSHRDEIRVIASGFQEFLIKQYNDFDGPFVNFATTLKLTVFSNDEIEELIVDPLCIWGEIENKKNLVEKIANNIGRHPYILQHLGRYIFEKVFESGTTHNIDTILNSCIKTENIKIFENPLDEMFYQNNSPVEKFIYLERCRIAETENEKITNCVIDDEWLEKKLNSIGIKSNYTGRRFILERLELYGLTTSFANNVTRQKISTPIFYYYIKKSEKKIEQLINTFKEELKIDNENFIQ